ncbi:MAG: type II toxin-antitoxin system VapC family toxin [Polyangiaceae bacterium]
MDTDVFSEAARAKPNANVIAWLRTNESSLYLSVVTIGELRRGIDRLPEGKRRDALLQWLGKVQDTMKGRVLSFNLSVANVWGQLKASWDARGIVVPSLDSQIAATAQRYGLSLVTRNLRHFRNTGVPIVNPFD